MHDHIKVGDLVTIREIRDIPLLSEMARAGKPPRRIAPWLVIDVSTDLEYATCLGPEGDTFPVSFSNLVSFEEW